MYFAPVKSAMDSVFDYDASPEDSPIAILPGLMLLMLLAREPSPNPSSQNRYV